MPEPLKTLHARITALGNTSEERWLLEEGLRLFLASDIGQKVDLNAIVDQKPECFKVPRSFLLVVLSSRRLCGDHHALRTERRRNRAARFDNALWNELLAGIAEGDFL